MFGHRPTQPGLAEEMRRQRGAPEVDPLPPVHCLQSGWLL